MLKVQGSNPSLEGLRIKSKSCDLILSKKAGLELKTRKISLKVDKTILK